MEHPKLSFVAITAIALVMLALGAVPITAQQNKNKRPSPPASAQCQLPNGKTLKVNYSSPRMRGRKIYGGLVPYGKVWRVGANEATTFDTDVNLSVDGKTVPAGDYTMFAIPEPGKWTLIISKKTGEWGIPYPGAQYDFTRAPMKVSRLKTPVQDFTISFARTRDGCSMNFDWAATRATILIREKK